MKPQSDLFGSSDPRDYTGTLARPKFHVPESPARVAVAQKGASPVIVVQLVQPELFDQAQPRDRIEYRGYRATYISRGVWSVSLTGRAARFMNLGNLRLAALSILTQWRDESFSEQSTGPKEPRVSDENGTPSLARGGAETFPNATVSESTVSEGNASVSGHGRDISPQKHSKPKK